MLPQVSAVAERIVGGTIAPDASLMQAGLDSLGAVDLRRELAAALQLGAGLH
jgi:aryl carrier-like protein